MTELAYPLPEIGEPSISADPRTLEALIAIKTWAAGQITASNIAAGGIGEAQLGQNTVSEIKLTKPVQELLNAKTSGLEYKATEAASLTAAAGQLIECKKAGGGTTVKCPTPTANRAFTVFSGVGTNTLKAEGGAKLFGDFVVGQETVSIPVNQHVSVFANGTHWLITAGEAKGRAVEGTASTLGFYGAELKTKKSLKGATATASEIVTLLAELGLVTNIP